MLIGESNVAIDPAIGGYGVADIYLGEFSPHKAVVTHVKGGELKEDLGNFDGYSRVSADMNQLARAVFKEFHEEKKGYSLVCNIHWYVISADTFLTSCGRVGAASRRWAEKKRHSRGRLRQGLPHSANLRGKHT